MATDVKGFLETLLDATEASHGMHVLATPAGDGLQTLSLYLPVAVVASLGYEDPTPSPDPSVPPRVRLIHDPATIAGADVGFARQFAHEHTRGRVGLLSWRLIASVANALNHLELDPRLRDLEKPNQGSMALLSQATGLGWTDEDTLRMQDAERDHTRLFVSLATQAARRGLERLPSETERLAVYRVFVARIRRRLDETGGISAKELKARLRALEEVDPADISNAALTAEGDRVASDSGDA